MTRMEEYAALHAELVQEPKGLETSVERALKRRTACRKKARTWIASGASIAVCFAVFVLLVNLSVPFARACGGVPVLRELARAVAWSPSLSAAVENEYVQPIDQTRTADGVTANVEYVIVDRRQVSIFYTLTAQPDRPLDADAKISGAQGAELDGFSLSSGSYGTPNGQLRQVDVSFVDRDVPPALDLTLNIYENRWQEAEEQAAAPQDEDPFSTSERPKYLASLTFTLTFDPYFTEQGETAAVNRTFQLDGQTLTLKTAEIYPTHLRLDFGYAPENTAWLTGLEFYVEDERGNRFEPVTNGISASGEEASPSMVTFWMDTTYFSDSKELTLYITRSRWLDKEREEIRLDLASGAHDPLPDGAELAGISRSGSGWLVTFRERMYRENWYYSLWSGFSDASGEERSPTSSASSSTWTDPETGAHEDGSRDGWFFETLALPDVEGTEVLLTPTFTRTAEHTPPIAVAIR